MNHWPSILARGDGGLWELVPVLIFVAISIIGSILKKTATDRDEKKRIEENAQRAQRDRLRARQAEARRQEAQARPKPQQQAPAPMHRKAAPSPRRPVTRMGVPPVQQPPRRIPQRQVPPPAALTPDQAVHAMEQRLEREAQQRARRLAARKSPEADSRAIEDRLVSVHPSIALPAQPTTESEATFRLVLNDRQQLRSAIIFHEVFSRPKALRTEPEVWES